jgi:hypothetical protein
MRSIIIYASVLVCLLTDCFADPSTDLHTADSLLSAGALQEASLMFELIIYENPGNDSLIFQTLLHKTECLKVQGLYDRIEPLLRRIDVNSLDDSSKFVVQYEKGLGLYLAEDFYSAEKFILPMFNINISTDQLHASKILYSLILNEMGRWKEASVMLNETISADLTLTMEEKQRGLSMVNDIYNSKKMPNLKSIKKARTLSLLFPGLGQLYNGNTGTAALSFSFVSLSGLYIAYNIINTTYLTAATSGVYLFLYFYLGGANQSSVLVPQKNYIKKTKYNNYLRESLVELSRNIYKL